MSLAVYHTKLINLGGGNSFFGTNVLLNQIPCKMGMWYASKSVCSYNVFECQSKIMNVIWGCLDRRIPFWECWSLNQNKSELSEQWNFSRERKYQMSQYHHGFITPRWSERSGVLYFKINPNASAVLLCFLFLLFGCHFVWFFLGVGITFYCGGEEMGWGLEEVLAALMSNFVNSRCLGALKMQK